MISVALCSPQQYIFLMKLFSKGVLPKFIGYGVLLFVVSNAVLFVLSIVTRTERPVDYWWAGVFMAVPLAVCSLWFSRKFHPESFAQSFSFGVLWALLLAIFLLFITIPNHTTTIFFGQWTSSLLFVGVALGPLLMKPKEENASSSRSEKQ